MEKVRTIQEYVPGKQVTMAHIIANPDQDLYQRIGLEANNNALGILTITPSEASLIAADKATKSGNVQIGFLDRFTGSLVITGDVSSVENSIDQILKTLNEVLGFTIPKITRS